MKTTLFIIGFAFLGILLSFWAYLLFFGSPADVSQVFVDLGLQNPTLERPLGTNEADINDSDTLLISNPLNQLTTKSVAGYIAVSRPTDRVRYVERGTGHIYEINFTTNIETRLVGNTFAKTTDAYFSPDGLLAALVRETDVGTSVSLVTIPENTGEASVVTPLPDNISEIKVLSSSTINYIETTETQAVGYRFNRLSGTATELWRIPLTDIRVWWGNNKTYVVNKTAPGLKGAVYEVVGNGQLIPITEQEYAYTAMFNELNGDIISTNYNSESRVLTSQKHKVGENQSTEIAILIIPEKCTIKPNDTNYLWCGAPVPDNTNNRRDYIKDWYSGEVISADYLWEINLHNQVSRVGINLKKEAGFNIDLINPKFNQTGDRLFFLNKLNDTLWLYNLPKTTEVNDDAITI